MNCTIKWKKLNDKATIPTKRKEDAGFDIYTIEDDIELLPLQKKLFSTGLAYSIDSNHWLLAFDRGSTGSKGIHTHCGICDSGYRGEVFICLCNDNPYSVIFTSKVEKAYYDEEECVFYYPTSKAIAQLIPMPQIQVDSSEADDEEWELLKTNSQRGCGKLGDSGK